MSDARFNVIGVAISATDLPRAVDTILSWRQRGERHFVSTCTAHTLVECQRNPALRERINGAALAVPDGMPLVWLARKHGYPDVSRVYGPDLLLAVCEAGLPLGLRHFFYGGAPGVPERLAARLQQHFPSLSVVGCISPPYGELTTEEDAALVEQINAVAPDIVWVGLGTPKQDFWSADHVGRLTASALIGVGAAFDFHSGRVRQAPPWVQRSGLEWLFRLVQEPRRLWRRYLVDNAIFVYHVGAQSLGLRAYPIETKGIG
jgi:N-acetylglucosaminyldiphosphoundecaprenol N-acetyl-beta-D-mannosaminyltransferase